MRETSRGRLKLLVFAVFTAGCSGSTEPAQPRYGEIAGTYDVQAPYTHVTGMRMEGTFVFEDDSRDTPEFSGRYSLRTIEPDGNAGQTFSGVINSGSVTESGSVSFSIGFAGFDWTGKLAGGSITGGWRFPNPGITFTGQFTATRR